MAVFACEYEISYVLRRCPFLLRHLLKLVSHALVVSHQALNDQIYYAKLLIQLDNDRRG